MKKPDDGGIATRRPQREAAVLGGDQVVAVLLQLVARVRDQLRLVEHIAAQDHAELAARARLIREGERDAGDLLHRIQAGAALERGERVLVGL